MLTLVERRVCPHDLPPTTMTPILSSIAAPISSPSPVSLTHQLSSSSIQSFAAVTAGTSSPRASLRLADVVTDSIRVEGLRHAKVTLKAK